MQQAAPTPPTPDRGIGSAILRTVGWMLILPSLAVLLVGGYAYREIDRYFAAHEDRIYTGVSTMDLALGGQTRAEAVASLTALAAEIDAVGVTLVHPNTQVETVYRWSEFGVQLDVDTMVAQGFEFGRKSTDDARTIFDGWYWGHNIAPVWIVDEIQLDNRLSQLASQYAVTSQDASYEVSEQQVLVTQSQGGLRLNTDAIKQQVLANVGSLTGISAEMQFDAIDPTVDTVAPTANQIASWLDGDRELYIEQPLDVADLDPAILPIAEIDSWLRYDSAGQPFIDEQAVADWVARLSDRYQRGTRDARFYFDDITEELVVVEPHVNGRTLDVTATTANLLDALENNEKAAPLVFNIVVPAIHSGVKGADLGITELLAEETTWFFDSPPERKQNIRVGAEKFYGIVIRPGEEFSFNRILGPISYENGFTDGLVIIGGRTQGGIGGGICQVSTTMFQTAFWAGLDIVERNQHGYRVSYYEDAPDGIFKPAGMDAAIYSSPNPDLNVDFTFINNTPHHLLIESYYSEENESLRIKFYSTNIGRVVERNITTADEADPPPTRYEYNPELDAGEIEQVEWAAEGGIVSIYRVVYNRFGDVRDEEFFVSRYTPWADVYQYGDGADIP